jgi:tetratricopeptide (TPR) repeat protein
MKILRFLFFLAFFNISEAESVEVQEYNKGIVPKNGQISDFEAELTLIQILSRHKETQDAALGYYQQLLKDGHLTHRDHNWDNLAIISDHSKNLKENTIVPIYNRVSDSEVYLALARIFSHKSDTQEKALTLYIKLLHDEPENLDVIIETGRLYLALKRYEEGVTLLENALEKYPCNVKLLVATAQGEASIGHAKRSQYLFSRALEISPSDLDLLLSFADGMMSWGDFFQAEQIYRKALDEKPCSLDFRLKLAWSLTSADRYEEAEQIYQYLLTLWPNQPKILEALLQVKILAKDYCEALEVVEQLLSLYPNESQYLGLKGYILYMQYSYRESIAVYESFQNDLKMGSLALVGIGKVYKKLGLLCESENAFAEAFDLAPKKIVSQFYHAGDRVLESDFLQDLICSQSPNQLLEWASLYIENGFIGQTIAIYQAVLESDSQNFPAKIGLAESLSTLFYFNSSLDIYEELLEAFPKNIKLLIGKARLLAWSKRYGESVEFYDTVIQVNPCNPVLYREKARTALWGKWFDISMVSFKQLVSTPVDQLLLEKLNLFCEEEVTNRFLNFVDDLKVLVSFGSIYQGYEIFTEMFNESACELSPKNQRLIQQMVIDLYAEYLIQKSTVLEVRAKTFEWNKYYIHSLDAFEKFLDFKPGDEEILFTTAQNYCILGLCNCSRSIYEDMLHKDPNHNLVKKALLRNEIRSRPLVQETFSYWRERGNDTFAQSQIARYRSDTVYEYPLSCRSHLRLSQQFYVENPFNNFNFYPAQGQILEGDSVINEYVTWLSNIGYRTFFHEFEPTLTAHNRLFINANDYFQMGLSYDREDIIYNLFSLEQATQANITGVTITSNITPYFLVGGAFQFYHYNDHNQQVHYNITSEYQLTDEPNIFKIIVNGDFRNTAHDSILIFDGPTLVNVIHPYWTPLNYYYADITLECRHDYRCFLFCESPQRYIDLKLSTGTDSVDNPFIQGILEIKHEFDTHFGFELKGYIHRSREWNAEGAWGTLSYRF